jgi:hypothetical protein
MPAEIKEADIYFFAESDKTAERVSDQNTSPLIASEGRRCVFIICP